MDAQTIATAEYIDILFDNRNKAYGGYVLRKYEDARMRKAMVLLLGICAVGVCLVTLPGDTTTTPPPMEIVTALTDINELIPPKPKLIEPEPPAAAVKPTIQNPVPKVVPDAKVVISPPPVDSFNVRESGPVTNNGETGGTALKTGKQSDTGKGAPVPPTFGPLIIAEVMPDFIGDIYAYLAKNVRYPRRAVESGIEGKVVVRFVVNENGDISDSKVLRGIGGGCNEEALRVVNEMPRWKPGKQNGIAVKVYFTLPIVFRLE